MLLFMDVVQLIQWIEGDSLQMLLFIVTDSCPSGESIREGPAVNCEANAVQDGHTGVLGTPESGGKQVRGTKRRRRRSHSDWRENGLDNVWGRGKILSGGE